MRSVAELKNIVAQMTLEEKARLCAQGIYSEGLYIGRLDRLGMPGANISDASECVFLSRAPLSKAELEATPDVRSTCFPSFSVLASSWDRELLREIGEACGWESRAKNVQVLLKPGVNIKRSPLCGRNYEYFSEDPFLTGELAGEYINGIQSTKTSACIKHYLANNQEHERMVTNAVIDERTMREIYLEPFRIAIEKSDPWTIMTSYNGINCCWSNDNKHLIQDILRGEWGYEGVIQSDGSAVQSNKVSGHANGLDVEGNGPLEHTGEILEAVADGRISVKRLDDICLRQFIFAEKVQGESRPVDYDKNHELAVRAAEDGAVLLQNDGILPLDRECGVAVIGAMADFPAYMGSGASYSNARRLECGLENIGAIIGREPPYAPGYPNEGSLDAYDEALIAQAETIVGPETTAVIFAGLPYPIDSETVDRPSIMLPAGQIELIHRIAARTKNVVLCVHAGSAVDLSAFTNEVRAILYMGLAGEGTGKACARILYGLAEPGGRLNETFPMRLEDTPAYLNFPSASMHMKDVIYGERIYVGYRYYDAKHLPVLYPFGHGLSYTTFSLDSLELNAGRIDRDDTLTVSASVTNTGDRPGSQVVQLYVSDGHSHVDRPEKELKGFAKVRLRPGETKTVSIELGSRAFSYWSDERGCWVVEEGSFTIHAGFSAGDIRLSEKIYVESGDKWVDFNERTAVDLILNSKNYSEAASFLPEDTRKRLEDMGFLRQVPACRLATMPREQGPGVTASEPIMTKQELQEFLRRLNTL